MTNNPIRHAAVAIPQRIVTIRGQKVILDTDLAALYGVPVKRLNEQVKRNASRFPEDFMLRLTVAEAASARALRSQIATLKQGGHRKYLPYAFTEQGVLMAATVLTPRAVPPNMQPTGSC